VRLLVTRPDPDGARTAALLRGRGYEVLQQPLLRIESVVDAELGSGPWAAVLFTSANAARAVENHRRFKEIGGLPAYTVGRRTQAAAAAAGFGPVVSAEGDVNALAALIASNLPQMNSPVVREGSTANSSPPPCGEGRGVGVVRYGTAVPHCTTPHTVPLPQEGRESLVARSQSSFGSANLPLLYCAGEDRAGDLAGSLQVRGLRVETVCVYRAAMVADLAPEVRAALAGGAIDAVLHYSARTAAAFVATATAAGIRDLSIQARHLCLSAQVATPLAAAGARAIDVASEPNERALFALIAPSPGR
jgi:uroporphyrinogen-III synthase